MKRGRCLMVLMLGSILLAGGVARAQGGQELLEVEFANRKQAPSIKQVTGVVPGSQVMLWGTARRYEKIPYAGGKTRHKSSSHVYYVSAPRGTDLSTLNKQLKKLGVGVSRPGGRVVDNFNSISVEIHGKVAGRRVREIAHVPVSRVLRDPSSITSPQKMLRYTDASFQQAVKKLGIRGARVRTRAWATDHGTTLRVPLRQRARVLARKISGKIHR